MCKSGEAEDQTHMLATCKLYDLERKALVDGVGEWMKPEQVAAVKAACLLDPDQWPAELRATPIFGRSSLRRSANGHGLLVHWMADSQPVRFILL
jgi:hypothetical protein